MKLEKRVMCIVKPYHTVRSDKFLRVTVTEDGDSVPTIGETLWFGHHERMCFVDCWFGEPWLG
jgi:hypothetical protein